MRPVQRLLMKMSRMGDLRVISAPAVSMIRRSRLEQQMKWQPQRCYTQNVGNFRRKTTTLQSMREFFMHPLTWDRNNGYLNVVLALAIFAFIFVNSCTPCPEDRVVVDKKKD